jgi:hypothetical protein
MVFFEKKARFFTQNDRLEPFFVKILKTKSIFKN